MAENAPEFWRFLFLVLGLSGANFWGFLPTLGGPGINFFFLRLFAGISQEILEPGIEGTKK